ncbi:MAG: hypothetical protein RQ867_02920, partial [Mariprofundaceae bacterium]|nr:hypothetical protein [Mariprofundaceae bacterium]
MKLIILLVSLSMLSLDALANGGPVAWTGITPLGGIRLQEVKEVELVKENLIISMEDNLNDYSVLAEYQLKNDGAPRKLLFGIPITWSSEEDYRIEPTEDEVNEIKSKRIEELSAIANDLSISVNNKTYKCTPVKLSNLSTVPEPYSESLITKNWCVTTIALDKKENTVILKYTANLSFVDSSFSKSALTYYEGRKLIYELYPAGYWANKQTALDIDINLGKYEDHVDHISLDGYKRNDGHLTWSIKKADLNKLSLLEISFNKDILRKNELAHWNAKAPDYQKVKLRAQASSELKSNKGYRYKASNILDGDPRTAWCEGKSGDGVEESIKLFPIDKKINFGEFYCRLEGIGLLPGYTKSQNTYRGNNRIKKVQISDCKRKGSHVFEVPLSKKHDMSPVLIKNQAKKEEWDKFLSDYK